MLRPTPVNTNQCNENQNFFTLNSHFMFSCNCIHNIPQHWNTGVSYIKITCFPSVLYGGRLQILIHPWAPVPFAIEKMPVGGGIRFVAKSECFTIAIWKDMAHHSCWTYSKWTQIWQWITLYRCMYYQLCTKCTCLLTSSDPHNSIVQFVFIICTQLREFHAHPSLQLSVR